ncbi:TPA: dTDP-4-dehydrorhamnose reductase [Serratia marcescens]|uniref:dTDP-4-dehydrorhamnose reductase n=1 Tax=Serratia TaxID=613 RepID=UPI00074551EF|nr:dTDP-4-dehydrorhamnose reductase [Serratia marcescens]MDP8619653.1 dTDP-4-dehydrorhamnose reductase [Serratia marcescens]CUY43087.1 dTDP-4-dehydrorhamnose reductase [Serratia marcescens]HAT2906762.1 dTDP-4-dehydrorhamnose reductase [Serratia marcescens]HAT3745660.1 dTDP-4-dehydrorhamnose reductase [Serratia marcescens]HAT3785037.1 dTDP-4-dehydrorhamnose reductase [Serratia marcescens]
MRVLLTGAKGQVGRCFIDRVPADWVILAADRNTMDISKLEQVKAVVQEFKPTAIINAAAYTAVDKAEQDCEAALLANVVGPANLAMVANAMECRLLHISTDYVFDGLGRLPYNELAGTRPLCIYGKTKRDGELAIVSEMQDAIILRTSWVFSEYGENFVKTMLRLAKQRESLDIVADQRGCPTYAGDIADAMIKMLLCEAQGGIYHFCGDEEVCWSEFAEHIFKVAAEVGAISRMPKVSKITSEQYVTLAKRPKYSTLSCNKINGIGIPSSNWQSALEYVISQLRKIGYLQE